MTALAERVAAADPRGAALPAPLRVLVVEDYPEDFEVLVSFLERGDADIRAERVEDEPGLREALARGPWDVVISDHNLPRFDSASAHRVLRETDPETPFIIVSGHIGEDVAVDAMLNGADDYVMKHSLARLRPAISRCLSAREDRRRKREAEARLAAVVHNLPGAVFEMRYALEGGDARFTYLSHGAEALLGENPADLIARSENFFARTADGPGERLADRLAACARAGNPLDWEGRYGRDGRWIAVRASPRRIEPGALHWYGTIMDVSALMHAEAELRDSREKLRELTAAWEMRMQEERAGFARELHDDVGGALTALKVDLDWLRRRAGAELQPKIESIRKLADSVVGASTRLARALRPGVLDYGIAAAIEAKAADFSERMAIPCGFRCNRSDLELSSAQSHALYCVFQEALTNITKHAGATRVDADLFATDDEVTLEVRDDGRGFGDEAQKKPDSFGLRGMRERVDRLGGWIDISGGPGKGTTVMVGIPRQGAARNGEASA